MPQLRTTKQHPAKLSALILLSLIGSMILPRLPGVASGAALAQKKEDSGASRARKESDATPSALPVIAPGSAYRQTNLVSDTPGLAPVLDPLLVNPWGISLTGTSPFWVANNRTSTSTLYRETSTLPLARSPGLAGVTIPGGLPTGTVANPSTTDFVLPGACAGPPCAANFLFASLTGNIAGWDPNAPAAGSTTAVVAARPPNNPGPNVYTGLAGLTFEPGQSSTTFRLLLVNDLSAEGSETVELYISNPTGAGAGLGTPNRAELTIIDNDAAAPATNPIDGAEFFVRQHYRDFLNREPEPSGLAAWLAVLTNCPNQFNTSSTGPSVLCDRIAVSSSFFRSTEFQSRGAFALRFYRAAYARDATYAEFVSDLSRLGGATPAETNAARGLRR